MWLASVLTRQRRSEAQSRPPTSPESGPPSLLGKPCKRYLDCPRDIGVAMATSGAKAEGARRVAAVSCFDDQPWLMRRRAKIAWVDNEQRLRNELEQTYQHRPAVLTEAMRTFAVRQACPPLG